MREPINQDSRLGAIGAFKRRWKQRWRYVKQNEPLWSWRLGSWNIDAGFFLGVGLGVTVSSGEFSLYVGPFALGGVRE